MFRISRYLPKYSSNPINARHDLTNLFNYLSFKSRVFSNVFSANRLKLVISQFRFSFNHKKSSILKGHHFLFQEDYLSDFQASRKYNLSIRLVFLLKNRCFPIFCNLKIFKSDFHIIKDLKA